MIEKDIIEQEEKGLMEVPASAVVVDDMGAVIGDSVLCGLGINWGLEDGTVEWNEASLRAAGVLANGGTVKEAAYASGLDDVEVEGLCRIKAFVERVEYEIEHGGVANLSAQLQGLNTINRRLMREFEARDLSVDDLNSKDLIREIRAVGKEARDILKEKKGGDTGTGISHLTLQFAMSVEGKTVKELREMMQRREEILGLAEAASVVEDENIIDVEVIEIKNEVDVLDAAVVEPDIFE